MEVLVEKSNVQQEVFNCENLVRQESVPEVIPEWLTDEFVEKTLRNFFKDNGIKINRIIVNNCGGGGESYASMMFRVSAYYHHQTSPCDIKLKSIIVKTLPQNEMALEKLGKAHYNVQNKEMTFYETVIPEFEKILAEIGEDGKTFPTVMAVYREIDVIVLEDLREKKFVMSDRFKGLDLAHMKLSLNALAKIHAASLVLYAKDEKAFEGFEIGFYNRETRAFDVMYESNLQALSEEVATWTEWNESPYFADKLKKFQSVLMENGCKAFDLNESDLNVFNHGDLWTNNLLFTYGCDETPSEAIILDFQYTFYGAASLDLLYFLFTSLPDHLRMEKMEEMVQLYYYELKSLLERLKFDTRKLPSLHEFQIEFLRKYFYGFSACLLTVPIMINQEKDANFEALMNADEWGKDFKRRIYKNPRVKKIAMEWLPVFDRRGLFDEL